jgi:hypothetical protein
VAQPSTFHSSLLAPFQTAVRSFFVASILCVLYGSCVLASLASQSLRVQAMKLRQAFAAEIEIRQEK